MLRARWNYREVYSGEVLVKPGLVGPVVNVISASAT